MKSEPPLKKEIAHRIGIARQLKSSPRSAQPRSQCCKASATSVARWEKGNPSIEIPDDPSFPRWNLEWNTSVVAVSQSADPDFRHLNYDLKACGKPWKKTLRNYRGTKACLKKLSGQQSHCGSKLFLWKILRMAAQASAPAWRWKDPMLHDEHLYSPVAESLFASLCDQTTLIDFKCGGVQSCWYLGRFTNFSAALTFLFPRIVGAKKGMVQ